MPQDGPKKSAQGDAGGVTEALRAAIERTLAATAPAASETRERAEEIVEEISKRGNEARDEVARRGQQAGAELARRGQEARAALAKRGTEASAELRGQLEALDRRLEAIEELLQRERRGAAGAESAGEADSNPEAKS